MSIIYNPQAYNISVADRLRFLRALKKVLDEADFTAVVEPYNEIEFDRTWVDDGHERAIHDLFRLLGGWITIDITAEISNDLTSYEENHFEVEIVKKGEGND